MTIGTILPLVAAAMLGVTTSLGAQEQSLDRILAEDALWGKDWPAALASLPAWIQIGDRTVEIFPHSVVGGNRYDEAGAAERIAAQLLRSMDLPQREVMPAFTSTVEPYLGQRPLQAVAEARAVPEVHRSHRVAWSAPSLEFLAAELTVDRVVAILGKPQEIRTVAIQTDSDRRPEILSVQVYAGGDVGFAESDLAPSPGYIDRVILEVAPAAGTVFRNVP